jgi:hypothetical protein
MTVRSWCLAWDRRCALVSPVRGAWCLTERLDLQMPYMGHAARSALRSTGTPPEILLAGDGRSISPQRISAGSSKSNGGKDANRSIYELIRRQ